MPRLFTDLLEPHTLFTQLFGKHQEALVRFDLSVARRHLEQFADELEGHIVLEEELILPNSLSTSCPAPFCG